ncbi:PASTA domain-containing protein [Herbidospora yilanensis]|uniref:PASTA domain-containing protein n=1 Tax=Herbidospora yilanensis TaxID=354426 RepID=UPI000780F079|nr:PASTA domain-containing protein [Herbidospora yilanensis]
MGLLNITVPNIRAYDFGVGVDRLSGAPMTRAVTATQTPPEASAGRTMSFEVTRIESSEELERKLGIDIEASAGCASFGAGASARFSFMKDSKVHSSCLFMTITSVVRLADLSIDQPTLTSEAAAATARPDVFRARYGDMFCRACARGGIFVGVLRIDTRDSSEATTLSAELSGSYGLFSSEAKVSFNETLAKHQAQSFYRLYTEGGPQLNIRNPFDPAELLELANLWQKGMQDDPNCSVPYEWTLSALTIAEGPMPLNAAQLQQAQDVLQFCARERTDLLDRLNACEWVNDHADRYDWTGGITQDQLRQVSQAAQVDLDLVAQCASAAIDDPGGATMPAEFAASRSKVYPSAAVVALPQPKPGTPRERQIELPDMVGKSFATARALLAQRGLQSQYSAPTEITQNGQVLVGSIVGMDPPAKSMVAASTVVTLEIGDYREKTLVKRLGKSPSG